jgi:hypothetical protein
MCVCVSVCVSVCVVVCVCVCVCVCVRLVCVCASIFLIFHTHLLILTLTYTHANTHTHTHTHPGPSVDSTSKNITTYRTTHYYHCILHIITTVYCALLPLYTTHYYHCILHIITTVYYYYKHTLDEVSTTARESMHTHCLSHTRPTSCAAASSTFAPSTTPV